jgi:hypothetical protein
MRGMVAAGGRKKEGADLQSRKRPSSLTLSFNPSSPIPNLQSPIPNLQSLIPNPEGLAVWPAGNYDDG